MRLFYLIATVVLGLAILVVSFAQVGATCTWYLINATAPAYLVLLEIAILGGLTGAALVMFFKSPKPAEDDEEPEIQSIE